MGEKAKNTLALISGFSLFTPVTEALIAHRLWFQAIYRVVRRAFEDGVGQKDIALMLVAGNRRVKGLLQEY